MRVHAPVAPAPEPAAPEPESMDLHVVYEDDALLVVSKPPGLVVHPAPGHESGTLVNALLASSTPAGGEAMRPGIVHRLDAGTSGLMIVAKDDEAHALLTEAMAERRVSRTYLALAEGELESDTATIDAPIGRSPRHRKMMAVVAGGKESVTEITVLERLAQTCLLEVRPRTGRTHQIRVHLSAIGHPIVGDDVYGRTKLAGELGLTRPFLHAARLRFAHPVTGVELALEDPLPPDLTAALEHARVAAGPARG